jgi:hypothetical protein
MRLYNEFDSRDPRIGLLNPSSQCQTRMCGCADEKDESQSKRRSFTSCVSTIDVNPE